MMKKFWQKIKGWGGYPVVKAEVHLPETIAEVQEEIRTRQNVLARGSGYSYGDSSLHTAVISTRKLTRIISEGEDWVEVEAGSTLHQILQHLIPQRKFLAVTPGTTSITVGGAIASDVHGKNHAAAGSFFNITESLMLVNENGELVQCSRQENAALFYSCFGGMGLQGITVSAVVRTIPLPALAIKENQFVAGSVAEIFRLMEEKQAAPYLIAWLDLLGEDVTSVIKTGEWDLNTKGVSPLQPKVFSISFLFPFAPPRFLFRWYNRRYLAKAGKHPEHTIPLHQFFYPLDSIRNWRYVFGRKGLLQYHFRFPLTVSEKGIEAVIKTVRQSKAVCTLAVLKRFGKGNPETPNSFAKEGYNLALDFIHTPAAVQLISQLDEIVSALGGDVYKAKDALSHLPEPIESGKFQSLQNQRYAQGKQQ